jgi:acyl carrier protein
MTGDDSTAVEISEARILDDVAEVLHEIVGEEYALDLEIGMDTTFEADLELESIEFVALAEQIGERYGARVGMGFVQFLSEKDVDAIIALTVGDVVSHVTASLRDG